MKKLIIFNWADFCRNRYPSFYPRASLLYQFVLTLPITVASNERSFSKLKLIKNYLRSTMTNERLFYLIICSLEYDLLDQIDVEKLVNDWTKMKDRRICVKNWVIFLCHVLLLYSSFCYFNVIIAIFIDLKCCLKLQ